MVLTGDGPDQPSATAVIAAHALDTAVGSITVQPAQLDFGSVNAGATNDLTLSIGNTGAGPLVVSAISSTSPRFSVVSPAVPFTVSPGAVQAVTIRFSPTGNGIDGTGGAVPFNAHREHLRGAMALYNGVVYLTFASHSDTQPYHGELLGYDAQTLALVKTFITTPNGLEGGFWASGAGPAVDSQGNMFIPVANGSFDQTPSAFTKGTDWGESVLKLPTNTTGQIPLSFSNTLNWFTPNNWDFLNHGDLDPGSGGLLLLPDQTGGNHPHIMVGGGKGAVLYGERHGRRPVYRNGDGGNDRSGQLLVDEYCGNADTLTVDCQGPRRDLYTGGTGEWDITVSNAGGSSVTTGYTVNNFSTTAASWMHDSAGARCNCLFDATWIDGVGQRVDIREHQVRASMDNAGRRADKSHRGNDDLVPRLQTSRPLA